MKAVCLFCGASPGRDPAYMAAARDFGALLARRGMALVYGGGRVGMMGAAADGALAAGGTVFGVIPRHLLARELDHRGITRQHVVGSLAERKQLMAELSDAFVALPGGIGTLDELFEVWTWRQLGVQAKPCGLLEVAGFWRPLVAFLDHQVATGYLQPAHRGLLEIDTDAGRLLGRLAEVIRISE